MARVKITKRQYEKQKEELEARLRVAKMAREDMLNQEDWEHLNSQHDYISILEGELDDLCYRFQTRGSCIDPATRQLISANMD